MQYQSNLFDIILVSVLKNREENWLVTDNDTC